SLLDKTLVFKSVNRGAKAFDVEGSLNVVETDISGVQNIFTEFLDELDFYRSKRVDLLDELEFYKTQRVEFLNELENQRAEFVNEFESQRAEFLNELEFYKSQRVEYLKSLETYKQQCYEIVLNAKQQIEEDFGNLISELVWERVDNNAFYKVTFKIYGEVIKSMVISEGLKIEPPEFTLPDGCEIVDGWYEVDKDRLWDFDNDKVTADVALSLNFMTSGIAFNPNGKVKDLANATGDVYLPDYYNGKRVTHTEGAVINVSDGINVHFGRFTSYYVGIIAVGNNMRNMYYPKDGNYYYFRNCLYTDKKKLDIDAFVFAPRNTTQSIDIQPGCQNIAMYAISHNSNVKKISIPSTVTNINNYSIMGTGITSITIPASVVTLGATACPNNANLTDVYIEGDLSEKVRATTFLDSTVTPNRRPTLHVRPEYYNKYIQKGVNNYYTIEVIGKDYFDGNYTAKEQTE
ncbi:MAG: leucine-rich repeat protein, partial [Clostridia bacterium]|nr:leucine-rich repeat protein [Clostridia bacterium]